MEKCLEFLSKEKKADKNGRELFAFTAMLKCKSRRKTGLASFHGEELRPWKLEDHKLYVCNLSGELQGHLSFEDDRLYYVLIPMFENREVQVKILVAEDFRREKGYLKLDLWIRRLDQNNSLQEDINEKINELLYSYV